MIFDKYENKGDFHWSWYSDPNWAWYKECVDKIVSFCKRKSVLDAGAGDGLLTYKLAEAGCKPVVGIDNSREGIRLAQGHAKDSIWPIFKLYDIARPIEGFVMEYMVCLNVIEHLDRPETIVNIFRDNITEAGIIITDEAREEKGRYHKHEFTLDELQELFKEFRTVPFKIESTEFDKPITFIGIEVYKDKKRRGRPPKVK